MNDSKRHPVAALLHFDPLDTAVQITGKALSDQHGEMSEAGALGWVLMQQHEAAKEQILRERGDTVFQNSIDRYCTIIEQIGFEPVFDCSFESYENEELFLIYARADGLLLSFDTCRGHINGGHLYYNWQPTAEGAKEWHQYVHGGGWHWPNGVMGQGRINENDVWVGSHDCREALCFNIDRLTKYGSFRNPWVESPSLWLLHYGETRSNPAIAGTVANRIAQLPDWVQHMIGPNPVRA